MPLLVGLAVAFVLSVVLLATGNTIVPPHVWERFWNMPPGMGAFLGALLGFLGGALFNHWLARRRDDRLLDQRRYSATIALLSEIYVLMRETQICRAELARYRGEADKASRQLTSANVNIEVLMPAALPTEQILNRTEILSPPVTTAVIALCRLTGDFRTQMGSLLQRLSFARGAARVLSFTDRELNGIAANLEFLADKCGPVITKLIAEVATIANRLGCAVPEPPRASGWITEFPPDEKDGPEGTNTGPAEPPAPA